MATRIHIAAARNTTEDQLRGALGERFDEVDIQEAGGWHWLSASVWGVSGHELDEALKKLDGPSLRITTEDASRWYLLLFAKGQEPFVICHEFGGMGQYDDEDYREEEEYEDAIDFLREEGEERPNPFDEVAEDFADMGCPLPDELCERLRQLPLREALEQLHHSFAESTADALARFEIPHDRDEIIQCLTGESVDRAEWHHDVGDLPRFLTCLGMGEYWSDALKAQTSPPERKDEDVCKYVDETDYITPVLEKVPDVEPVSIEGGPVEHPVSRLAEVDYLPWFCGEWLSAVLLVELPADASLAADWPGINRVQAQRDGDSLKLGFRENVQLFASQCVPRLHEALAALPDGTVLELVTAGADQSEAKGQAGNHRYRGPIEGGTWHISEAWPAVSKEPLSEALALIAQIAEDNGFLAQSDEEADAIMEAASTHPTFWEAMPDRDGRRITVEGWRQRFLALLFFRQRFADTWDMEPGQAKDDEQYRDAYELEQEMTAPHSDEVILDGEQATYFRADIRELKKLDKKALRTADRDMAALGFEPLGDLLCDRVKGVIIRGYGAPESCIYGVHMQSIDGQAFSEFFSHFAGNTSFTTSNNYSAEIIPKQGIYARVYDDFDAAQLHEKHLDGVERFREHKGAEPRPFEPSLEALAQAIDDFLQRRFADGEGPGMIVCTLE